MREHRRREGKLPSCVYVSTDYLKKCMCEHDCVWFETQWCMGKKWIWVVPVYAQSLLLREAQTLARPRLKSFTLVDCD